MHEDTKSRLNSGNDFSGHRGQNIQNYNFVCCLNVGGTWSTPLREEERLRMFKNRALRRYLDVRTWK
jgi:hypothetical protein